jgi:hypothetical protein
MALVSPHVGSPDRATRPYSPLPRTKDQRRSCGRSYNPSREIRSTRPRRLRTHARLGRTPHLGSHLWSLIRISYSKMPSSASTRLALVLHVLLLGDETTADTRVDSARNLEDPEFNASSVLYFGDLWVVVGKYSIVLTKHVLRGLFRETNSSWWSASNLSLENLSSFQACACCRKVSPLSVSPWFFREYSL